MKRSYDQLRLYFAYIKQLRQASVIKVQFKGDWFQFRFGSIKEPRYLLKCLDEELPITNEHFPYNPNKNEFHGADMKDLTHHISWIEQVLWDNKIVPITYKELMKGL